MLRSSSHPRTMPMAASSSSACTMRKLFRYWIAPSGPGSGCGSRRYSRHRAVKLSITDVDGVIGYHAATVAPAYKQPSAVAVFPSIRILSRVASITSRWNGKGQSKCSLA